MNKLLTYAETKTIFGWKATAQPRPTVITISRVDSLSGNAGFSTLPLAFSRRRMSVGVGLPGSAEISPLVVARLLPATEASVGPWSERLYKPEHRRVKQKQWLVVSRNPIFCAMLWHLRVVESCFKLKPGLGPVFLLREGDWMSSRKLSMLAVLCAMLLASSCGSDVRLLSVQIYPANPNLAHNTSVYIAPSSTIQFQIQGWYSNRTAQTISSSSGKWSSTNTLIATVDANGLATSVGPEGVTSIVVNVNGHTSTVILGVCDPTVVVCPPL